MEVLAEAAVAGSLQDRLGRHRHIQRHHIHDLLHHIQRRHTQAHLPTPVHRLTVHHHQTLTLNQQVLVDMDGI